MSEFRSQWQNALIPAQNMTEAMELEINQKLAAMKGVDGFSTFSSLSKSSNAVNNSLTSPQEDGDFPIIPGMQRFGSPVATSILPPEAHLSRDGHLQLLCLWIMNTMHGIRWMQSHGILLIIHWMKFILILMEII